MQNTFYNGTGQQSYGGGGAGGGGGPPPPMHGRSMQNNAAAAPGVMSNPFGGATNTQATLAPPPISAQGNNNLMGNAQQAPPMHNQVAQQHGGGVGLGVGAAPPPPIGMPSTSTAAAARGGTGSTITSRPGYYAPTVTSSGSTAVAPPPNSNYPDYPSSTPQQAAGVYSGSDRTHSGAAQVEAIARDCAEFNSPPAFVRPSISKLPNSQTMKQKSKIPLGLLFQPLNDKYCSVPSVNFGSVGTVVRCKRCRTYINPFVQWEANGRRWVCNMCGYFNDTPNHYYNNLDETGKRSDRYERPELCNGSVEYIAPGEYMVRPPQPAAFLFVIDVSAPAIQSGLLDTAVRGIKTALESGRMPGGNRTQIGVITYDSSIHFYNLNQSLSQAQMLVVSDFEDVFIPLPVDDIMVNVSESEKVLNALLDALPGMHAQTKVTDACAGSALRAAHLALKHIGGKMLIFACQAPNIGENQLKLSRYNPRLLNTEREVELLKPVDESFKTLAVEMTRVQISVELFLCPQQYIDAASLAPLVKYTGGELHYYEKFNSQVYGDKLREEVLHVLARSVGWEAVMRIRVSRGWRITHFFGHLYIRGMDLLVVPNCHSDQTFGILLEMEENVIQEPIVCVQCALLYTNSSGERRIRVHTHCMPVTQSYADMCASMDAQAASCLLAQQAIDHALKAKISDARNFLQTTCSQIVSSMGNQPPDAIRLLPLYILGMLKSTAFKATSDVHPDMRVASWLRLESLPVDTQACYFYPRMIPLHVLDDAAGTTDQDGSITLPAPMNLSADNMSQDGAYLLEDGECMLLWIGRSIQPNWLHALFGVADINQLDPLMAADMIGTSGDLFSARIAAIIAGIRMERSPPFMNLVVLKQGDPSEARFFAGLVEDRTPGLQLTYSEFLSKLGGRPMAQAPGAQIGGGPATAARAY